MWGQRIGGTGLLWNRTGLGLEGAKRDGDLTEERQRKSECTKASRKGRLLEI